VGDGVETHVETIDSGLAAPPAGLALRLLGPLTVTRDGAALALPPSRKLRALLAYLAVSEKPVSRRRLCELLWDVPNDPRGELRWCLSKLRGVIDAPGRSRVVSSADLISLDLGDCWLDVAALQQATMLPLRQLETARLKSLAALFAGDFLDGMEIDRSPFFEAWLAAQRRHFRAAHAALLQHLAGRLAAEWDDAFPYLEKWLELSPVDEAAHLALLTVLMARGRIAAGDDHLAALAKLFEAEGLDLAPLRAAWRALKDRRAAGASATATSVDRPRASVPGPVMQNAQAGDAGAQPHAARRAALAVMPFSEMTEDGPRGGLADGLTHDIITRLAKLRDLFIIARGSVFALAERGVGAVEAGRQLNVDYVASGTVRQQAGRLRVTVELVEASTSHIVWAEHFDHRLDNVFLVIDDIGNKIVAAIASEIEVVERNRALLLPPNSLNAWQAYHRGLWHMYRFTKAENAQAQHYFQMALKQDPTFARAYAGLSFTHWQNAFQHWADRAQETDLAFATASQSLLVDEHNPAAHWAMGRALWLRGRQDQSLVALERSVALSPNFALGHYALSFVQSQSGDPQAAIQSSDHSRHLSPFDPLLFGMLGARAMAHIRLGQFAEAADWALKAADRPNAHVIILAIAAHCLALAGRIEEGRAFAAAIHQSLPQFRVDDFLATFRFTPEAELLFREGARRIDLA
jgi:DNA-binding SARP family transcriptional activator/TolB-like protein